MRKIINMFKIKHLLLLTFLFITLISNGKKTYMMTSAQSPPRIIGSNGSKSADIVIPTFKGQKLDLSYNGYDKQNNIFNIQYVTTAASLSFGIDIVSNDMFEDIEINYDGLYFEKEDGTSKITIYNGISKNGSFEYLNFLVPAQLLTPGKWRVRILVDGRGKAWFKKNRPFKQGDLVYMINVVECPSLSITNTPVCNTDQLVTTITATPINSPNYGLFNYTWYDYDAFKNIGDKKGETLTFTYFGQGVPNNSTDLTKKIKLVIQAKKYIFTCLIRDYDIKIDPFPEDPVVEPFPGCGFTTFKKNKSSDKNDYYYGSSPEVAKLGVNKLPDDAFGLKYTEEKDIYFMSKSRNGCWSQDASHFSKDKLGTKPSKPVVANLTPCQCELNAATFVGTVPPGATTLSWSGLADQMDQEGSTYAVPRELGVYTVRSVLKHPSNPQADCYSDPLTIYVDPIPCINCTSDFSPIPGETYVLSAWVKEISDKRTPLTYSFPYIDITYENTSATSGPFFAKGPIIEGWQKIETEVEIPSGASMFYLHLKSLPSKNDFPVSVYFDDIRIHPLKANMTSYVYDPITLKLVAELDANNFATFYSHDAEGNLISMKKETIDGIKTIKEGKKVPFRKNEENIRESTEPISITEPNSLYE